MTVLLESAKELDKYLKENPKAAVLFYASWCPFSQRFLPIFEEQAECYKESCRRVVVDDLDELVDKYKIEVYPTVLFFENGKITKRLDGLHGIGLNEKQLVEFLNGCGLPK